MPAALVERFSLRCPPVPSSSHVLVRGRGPAVPVRSGSASVGVGTPDQVVRVLAVLDGVTVVAVVSASGTGDEVLGTARGWGHP